MPALSVLVTGATGRQGGALARLLLQRGHHVVALTRDPNSAPAKALAASGAELRAGDFEDVDSLVRAMEGVQAAYAMATPFEGGPDAEVRHGRHLADAAVRAGLRHFVYSSVSGAELRTGIPHFDSKHEVELYVRAQRLPFTIVGPTWFMENFHEPSSLEQFREGVLAMGLPPHRGLQMVAMDDLAAFVALALELPDEFLGKRLDVASDEVTGEQAAALLTFVTGRRVHYEQVPLERIRARSEDMARMFEWLERVGYRADILSLRSEYPSVRWHTFEEWVRGQDWSELGPMTWPGVETSAGAGP
ncbi:NmrA/HSCARG family protein [Myxococcaceae bacterium GXIMD 01537]